jgi:putative nucleotidyltransferase with HDIG domain
VKRKRWCPLLPQRPSSKHHPALLAGVGIAAAAAGIGSILSWGVGAGWDISLTDTLVAFAAFIALGDLLEIPLGRRAGFSLVLAPGIAFALLRRCNTPLPDGECASALAFPHLGEVAVVFVLGCTASLCWRMVRRRELRLPLLAARLLVVLSAAAAYRLIPSVPKPFTFGPPDMSAPGLAVVLLLVLVIDVVLQAVLVLADENLPMRQVIREQLRATAPLLLSSVSVGALLALSYPVLQAWTLPLFLAPLAATQYSFKQVASIRTNYLQTVRALAKVPEMAGYTQRDHSARVAQLSVEIAKEIGIGDPELHEIEYGALLHDIGRISLPDPEDAAIRSTSSLQLALVGAEIIDETGHFPAVAAMVRDQHEPYRRRGEDVNRALPSGAKIIKVASAFDDLVHPGGPGHTAWDALERLHLGMAYEFDPAVIQALTRVLEKQIQI